MAAALRADNGAIENGALKQGKKSNDASKMNGGSHLPRSPDPIRPSCYSKSTNECVPLLELCRRQGWMNEEDHKERKSELEIISKMLSALANARD